jgi:hypothetical protein
MKRGLFNKKRMSGFRVIVFTVLIAVMALGTTMCAPAQPAAEQTEAPVAEVTEAPVVEMTEAPAPEVTEAPVVEPTEAPVEVATEAPAEDVTLAILHFSVIEGTTWSGARDRAAKRIVEKYPNVE